MDFSLCRLILYVQDVTVLSSFYQQHFGLSCIGSIPGEWIVLQSGSFELALHLAGPGYRGTAPGPGNNAKIVFETKKDLALLRERFIAEGIVMGTIKSYGGFDYNLLDGTDPEGNVFQLMQKIK
jgi:predicted enzyme related to lactoylglutathione lyase